MDRNRVVYQQLTQFSGQERFTVMRDLMMKSAHGFVLIYSIISKSSFEELSEIRKNVIRLKNVNPSTIPFILVGNKSDLTERQVTKTEGEELAREWNCPFFEVSAKLNDHVSDAFDCIIPMAIQVSEQVLKS